MVAQILRHGARGCWRHVGAAQRLPTSSLKSLPAGSSRVLGVKSIDTPLKIQYSAATFQDMAPSSNG